MALANSRKTGKKASFPLRVREANPQETRVCGLFLLPAGEKVARRVG